MTNASLNRIGTSILLLIFLAMAIALLANVPNRINAMEEQPIPEGDATHGAIAIAQYGCGTCHRIPGISGADGMVGTTLASLSRRSILAGQLPNNPANLIAWIQHPQQIEPGVAMPELGVSEADARDIAAFLYSLH